MTGPDGSAVAAYVAQQLALKERVESPPVATPAIATDWKAEAREMAAMIAKQAAKEGGTVADVAARVVALVCKRHAEQREQLDARLRELENKL